MNKKNLYVFDLDNTLIYTDYLNNESYKFALCKIGIENFEDINYSKRITRDYIHIRYPNLSDNEIKRLISIKQEYFINNIDKTILNKKLIDYINIISNKNCILWTMADKERVEAILEYYDLKRNFFDIYYSKKINIKQDIEYICNTYKCKINNLIFCDEDINIKKILELNNLKQLIY